MNNSLRYNQVKGTSSIIIDDPKVTLTSMTSNPVATLFSLWYGSRHNKSVDTQLVSNLLSDDIWSRVSHQSNNDDIILYRSLLNTAKLIVMSYPEIVKISISDIDKSVNNMYPNQLQYYSVVIINKIAELCIKADVPASESVVYTFQVDNASVAWRNQLVRSRTASYWTQTSRTTDLTTFDSVRLDSIYLYGNDDAIRIYEDTIDTIRDAYIKLSELGVPTEDIRLTPDSMTTRIYWTISLRHIIHLLRKRSDFIAQQSLWSPITSQVVHILRDTLPNLDIYQFIGKPEVQLSNSNGTYSVTYHKYDIENEDRYSGKDPLPVDPLWLAYKGISKLPKHTNMILYNKMKSVFIELWSDEYLEVLGWDRNDPSKIGYYDTKEL